MLGFLMRPKSTRTKISTKRSAAKQANISPVPVIRPINAPNVQIINEIIENTLDKVLKGFQADFLVAISKMNIIKVKSVGKELSTAPMARLKAKDVMKSSPLEELEMPAKIRPMIKDPISQTAARIICLILSALRCCCIFSTPYIQIFASSVEFL